MTTSIIRYKLKALSRPLSAYKPKGLFGVSDASTKSPATFNMGEEIKEDRRSEWRQPLSNRVLVQVVDNSDESQLKLTCSGQTSNVSPSGLCLISDTEIPIGAVLDIWCDNPGRSGSFFLAGQVIWCRQEALPGFRFHTGIRLMDIRSTDIEAWLQHIDLLAS